MTATTDTNAPHILLVEDNEDLALGLRNNLEIEGYGVTCVGDGESALTSGTAGIDLVILDLMLPGILGLEVLRQLRKREFSGPILILTARGEEEDKVRALKLGADDYLTKPFGLLELLARVEALLRRSAQATQVGAPVLHLRNLEVHRAQRTVLKRGKALELTPKEYDLLLALLEAEGAVVSRNDLQEKVWGYQDGVLTRTVDTHIAELRRKIEHDPKSPRYLLTVRKAGYRAGIDPRPKAS